MDRAAVPESVSIALIVACARNGVIGRDGGLPWSLPDDMKHFMRSTKGHAVVMGRTTFGSLPGPLSDRVCIVVSSSWEPPAGGEGGVRVARSVDEALEIGRRESERLGRSTLWIAGGESIYRATIGIADRVVRTLVDARVEGDRHFPELDASWTLVSSDPHGRDGSHAYAFTIEAWTRADRAHGS